MAAISFKSVGDLKRDPRSSQDPQPTPVGILTPVVKSGRIGGPFSMSNNITDQMVDNFRNMLLVNHGERLPFYDFGANLRSITTERLSQQDYDEQAMNLIKATTEKYMPYINLDSFESQILSATSDGISRIKIKIDFSIPKISTKQKTIEVVISNIG